MTVIDTQARTGGSTGEFTILETDVYRMKITSAAVEENKYADPRPDGSRPQQLVLCWEVSDVTEEQDESLIGAKVWHRINPYYGPVRDGGVSKFKAFIDMLREQGHLPDFAPNAFDIDTLVGIEQRVNVEKYTKGQGPNAGQLGNKVVGVLPLRRPRRTAPAARNVPQPIDETDDDGLL